MKGVTQAALRAALVYLGLTLPYILVSDWMVNHLIADQALKEFVASAKGTVSVGLTGLLIYWLLFRELSRREKAEAALRESEARFRRLAEHAPDIIYRYVLVPEPRLDYVSPAITAITGYTPEELYRSPELLAGGVLPRDRAQFEIAEQQPVVALRIRAKDGRIVWLEMRHGPVLDAAGRLVAVEGVARDITNQREAEAALRLQGAALEATANAIVITDRAGVIQWVNAAYTRLTGYTPDEAAGQNPRVLKSGTQDQAFYKAMWEAILAGEVWRGQLTNRRKDGSLYTEEQTITPVRSAAGDITHFVGVKQDISDQVLRQRELEVIAQVSAALRGASTRAEMLPLVLEQARLLLRAGDAFIVSPAAAGGDLLVELGQGSLAGPLTGQRLARSQSLSGELLATGQPYAAADIAADPRFIPPAGWPASALSAAGVPLTAGSQTVGVMWVHRPAPFTPEELNLLGVIAAITATALQRMTLYDQARRRTEQLAVLNELGNVLAETFELPEILQRLSQAAQKLLPDIATLFVSLYDPETKLITAAYGLHDGLVVDTRELTPMALQPAGEGTQSQVIRTGQPLIANDLKARLQNAPARILTGTPGPLTQSALYVPLKAKGAVVGVLQVHSDTPDRFGPADAELLALVGNTAAITIQNARLFAENMERLDTITALYVSAQKLSFNRDLDGLTGDVVRTCVDGYGARAAWLARAEPGGAFKVLAYYPAENSHLARLPARWDESPAGRNPAGRAVQTRFAVVIHDVRQDPVFEPWLDLADSQAVRSCIVLPLISHDEALGVLCLFASQPGFFRARRQSFLQAYAHQAAAALENARLGAETGRRLLQLQSLRAIDSAITGSLDLRLNLKIILDQVTTQLGSDAADLLILNKKTLLLEFAAGRGFNGSVRQPLRLQVGQGFAGQIALTRSPVIVTNLSDAPPNEQTRFLAAESFVSYYGTPLISKGQVIGVLEILHRRPLAPDAEWVEFLKALAEQSAIAIDNASLFENLQRTNLDLALAYDATIEGWSRAMDLRDRETEGHTQRVTDLSMSLAERVGLSGEELLQLRRGALLHDIGKMGVPDSILLKPGPLTETEWVTMRRHPVYAYEMLAPIAYLRPALDIPYCHHEKWDGTGYPRGLAGEQIPQAARIFAVVDVWDALRSDRPYRAAWADDKVRDHIQALSGTHFDPRVVEAFLRLE